jgi:dTDP-4-dehydrorhamnose reductase
MSTSLVIGASGQVGCHLAAALSAAGEEVVGSAVAPTGRTGFTHLDIRDAGAVTRVIDELRPAAVYLPAALTDVDGCEERPRDSYATNVAGVANVVDAARRFGSRLVFFSTDYIFDGHGGPYEEDSPSSPICVYGWHKALAEQHVACHLDEWLIVRTTVVYGWEPGGKNFIARLTASLREGREVRVPSDQLGTPTYAPALAAGVAQLALAGVRGVVHLAGPELLSRYDFARQAARVFGLDEDLVTPVATEELGQMAMRPLRAGLRTERARELGLAEHLVAPLDGLGQMAELGGAWPTLKETNV